jgi:hypothetical protein
MSEDVQSMVDRNNHDVTLSGEVRAVANRATTGSG